MHGTPAPSASGPQTAVSRDVSFVVAGTTTYGTLEIPAHRSGQRLAAALLIAGSGPTDRNGNDVAANLTPNILQLIAGVLAQMGIMSLRFDKYFSGQTPAPSPPTRVRSTWPPSSGRPTRLTASFAPSRRLIPARCWWWGTARAACMPCSWRSRWHRARPGWP